MNSIGEREAAITQIAQSDRALAALRRHIQEIVESAAFKGSHRSAQFLEYIIEHAIAGEFDSLKERMIGVELFGRSPAYDTSEDAIVRVTASDVRKRLLQHYGRNGTASEFRISLPLGSYIPEIAYSLQSAPPERDIPVTPHAHFHDVAAHPTPNGAPHESPAGGATAPDPASTAAPPHGNPTYKGAAPSAIARRRWQPWAVAAVFALLNLAAWLFATKHFLLKAGMAAAPEPPWSAFFASPRPTHLISSDPDFEAIQVLIGHPISLSDYINRRFLDEAGKLPPIVQRICKNILHGDKSSTIDAQIAVKVAELAKSYSRRIDVIGARDLQFSHLKTDDNFIFLGSPLSNPWFSVFDEQLDFRFVPVPAPPGDFFGIEVVRNFRPHAGEPATYVPTAKGGGTGESFAIVALVANPDQNGQVLLLAGADREGTEAAGNLVTDLPRLSAALAACGLTPSSPVRHFELLLRVDTMAGYPTRTAVAACHLLPGPAAR